MRPSRPPQDPKTRDPLDPHKTLSTPIRPETRNPESMYKNKVDTTRVQTRDPRATVLFVYANNGIIVFVFLKFPPFVWVAGVNIFMASKLVM